MAFPRGVVNEARLKKDCTLIYRPMGEEEDLEIPAYRVDGEYIHVPRQLGLSICAREGIPFEDMTSSGVAVKFPRIPEPRDYQIEPLIELGELANDYFDFIFRARTAWGKTIGGLIWAARRGRSTIVFVDQENLKDQWIASLTKFFGMTTDNIGIIQGKVCKYEGCPVTIAMVQTLSQKRMPQEVYDYFGTAIVDEVHVVGAPTFSKILMDFTATCRMGVSATPKRRDGLQKALDYNLGRVRLWIDDEHPVNSVFVAEHDSVYSFYANVSPKTGRFISEIAEDASRNLLLAQSAAFLYDTGRDILVLSDRIEHLQELMALCVYMGLPPEDLGMYTGYNLTYRIAKDATPKRRPNGYVRGTEYTPVKLQSISKRIKKSVLAETKTTARIIFATYGMFQKGVDEARLTGGIDATPRSRAEQVHGRILRGLPGARRSIWITVVDTSSYRALHGAAQRIPEYVGNNAELFRWSIEEGEVPCQDKELIAGYRQEVTRLKSSRIETNKGGLLTLVTPTQQVESVRQRVQDIKTKPESRVLRPVSSRVARRAR